MECREGGREAVHNEQPRSLVRWFVRSFVQLGLPACLSSLTPLRSLGSGDIKAVSVHACVSSSLIRILK